MPHYLASKFPSLGRFMDALLVYSCVFYFFSVCLHYMCKVSPMFSASMCARASVPSVPLRLQCIAFCCSRCLALAVLPYVLLPVRCWMRWCAIPWALASAPASSYAHALAGAYTTPWHRAHRSILRSA
ncbi:hypothetical protein V6N13_083077 [Hibiscus sabdariffa]